MLTWQRFLLTGKRERRDCGSTTLSQRADLTILTLPGGNAEPRPAPRAVLNECDVAILCLPEDAALEACDMVTEPHVHHRSFHRAPHLGRLGLRTAGSLGTADGNNLTARRA
ncbi:MAG: hypothetical protein R2881_07145 [Eubacteriales bacterium]